MSAAKRSLDAAATQPRKRSRIGLAYDDYGGLAYDDADSIALSKLQDFEREEELARRHEKWVVWWWCASRLFVFDI